MSLRNTSPTRRAGWGSITPNTSQTVSQTERRFQFQSNLKVAGVKRRSGEVVPESQIPTGHLESMLRQGQVTEFVESDLAQAFAAAMEGISSGDLVTLPEGLDIKPAPEFAALVAENQKLREQLADFEEEKRLDAEELARQAKEVAADPVLGSRTSAKAEIDRLRARVAELEAKPTTLLLPGGIDPEAARAVIAATEPPKPEEKPAEDKPTEAKPEAAKPAKAKAK